MHENKKNNLEGMLVDTWWYGLTHRMTEENFKKFAQLRVDQGFTAIQLVVGVPPEIGPNNKNAGSIVGPAWDMSGKFNDNYLKLAKKRIAFLNRIGLSVIVYGAWGYQINWLGTKKMLEWWEKLIDTLDELNVIYCITGEVDIYIGKERILLPDKTTTDLTKNKITLLLRRMFHPLVINILKRIQEKTLLSVIKNNKRRYEERKKNWGYILKNISKKTKKPIIVHPTEKTGFDSIGNPYLLSANTAQTGHNQKARRNLWMLPLERTIRNERFINLEPWYEGILDDFWQEDQLFAYWTSMLAGASSFCYGAHGIWNVGDGYFLAQWGTQTFEEAIKLKTPELLGKSHKEFLHFKEELEETFFYEDNDELLFIGRKGDKKEVYFFPEINKIKDIPDGLIWLPSKGIYHNQIPKRGQVVIFRN